MKKKPEDKAKHFGSILVARGFATRHILDSKTGRGYFEWTDSGRDLHRHVRHLFGVPPLDPSEVSQEDVLPLIGLILFTPD